MPRRKRNQYENAIDWKELEDYLFHERDKAFTDFIQAEGLQAVGRCQGRALALNALLNLPEILSLKGASPEELLE